MSALLLLRPANRHGFASLAALAVLITQAAFPSAGLIAPIIPTAYAVGESCGFTGTGDGTSFNDANNWDCGHVPTSEDDVFIGDGLVILPLSDITVLSLSLAGLAVISGVDESYNITVLNGATFSDASSNAAKIVGDVTFNDSSYNEGIVEGDATFNGTAGNAGTVNGDATFTASSFTFDPNENGGISGGLTFTSLTPVTFALSNTAIWTSDATHWTFDAAGPTWTFSDTSFNTGTVNGDAVFNDASYNGNTVQGNAQFNGTSNNEVTVSGDATFNESSFNNGTVSGDATFNDDSYNNGIVENATFNVASYNNSTVAGDATFNGTSHNDNYVSGNATFTGTSYNYGTVVGDATFNNVSYNDGTVTGNAVFNGTGYNSGTVAGDATFNGTGYNSGTVGDATFNDSSFNNGTVAGDATFNDASYNGNDVAGNATFNDASSNNSAVTNATFNGTSFNNAAVENATFNDASYNSATVENATFNDDSYNYGNVNGDATFVEDASYNNGEITGTRTRKYVSNTTTTKDFTTDDGYDDWIIVADGAVVDVSGATYGPNNEFQALNGGSFTANGEVEGSEGCDDENVVSGDGCSAAMAVETGYACTGEPSACMLIPASSPSPPSSTSSTPQSAGGGRGTERGTVPSPAPTHTAATDEDAPNSPDRVEDDQSTAMESDDPSEPPRASAGTPVREPVPSSQAARRLSYAEVESRLDAVLPVRPAPADRSGRVRAVAATDSMPRGSVIAMILERLGIAMDETHSPFTDVVPGSRDAKAMATAWRLGLVRGDTDEQGNPRGTSRPHEPITAREVTILIDRIERLRRGGVLVSR